MKTMQAILLFVPVICLFAACEYATEDNQFDANAFSETENPFVNAFIGSVGISITEKPVDVNAFSGSIGVNKTEKPVGANVFNGSGGINKTENRFDTNPFSWSGGINKTENRFDADAFSGSISISITEKPVDANAFSGSIGISISKRNAIETRSKEEPSFPFEILGYPWMPFLKLLIPGQQESPAVIQRGSTLEMYASFMAFSTINSLKGEIIVTLPVYGDIVAFDGVPTVLSGKYPLELGKDATMELILKVLPEAPLMTGYITLKLYNDEDEAYYGGKFNISIEE